MAEFKGIAGTGLGLGIAGTALGVMNGGLGNILGGILTPRQVVVDPGMTAGCNGYGNWGGCCSENQLINRYEAGKDARIAELETEVKLRDANTYTDQKILATYQYVDGQLKGIRDTLCAQAVHNQRTEDSFVLVNHDLCAVKNDLEAKIKLESERRCCADNSIVNYVNATFYPKMVADVTVGTTNTAQLLYNPIPDCGCCGGK